MNKFWQWMEKKGYGKLRPRCAYLIYNSNWGAEQEYEDIQEVDCPTKQMLIGYMMEYLYEKSESTNYFIHLRPTDELYEYLEKEIKEIK